MNAAEYNAKVICDVFDAMMNPPARIAPAPDQIRRVLVEVEIDVPVYITEDRDDGISVELAPVDTWRVAPVGPRMDEFLREDIASQLEDEANAAFEERMAGRDDEP